MAVSRRAPAARPSSSARPSSGRTGAGPARGGSRTPAQGGGAGGAGQAPVAGDGLRVLDDALLGAVAGGVGPDDYSPAPPELLDLQRVAGNAATAQFVQRAAPTGAAGPGSSPSLALQRIGMEPMPFQDPNLKNKVSLTGLGADYDKKSDAEKVVIIKDVLAQGQTAAVSYAWAHLGDEVGVARANAELFAQSVKLNDDILDHPAFEALKEKFKKDVEQTALNYLFENRRAVQDEMKATGVSLEPGQEQPDAGQDMAVQDIQKAAPLMEKIVKAKADIQNTPVGMMQAHQAGNITLKFDPAGPPPTGPNYWIPDNFAKWDEVNLNWRRTLAAEAALIQEHPSAAYFMNQGAADLGKLGNVADIKEARGAIGAGLNDLAGKIDKAVPLVGDDLTFIDFPPIHQQLLSGQVAPSGINWSGAMEKSVAKELISDATLTHLLTSLGIGLASGAFFVFASIATAGGAAVLGGVLAGLGVAGSAAQAGMSWDKYRDLAAANAATVDPEMALVTGDQVDSAMISAVLDTVFAFLDAYQAVKGAYVGIKGGKAALEAGKVGLESSSRATLKNLAKATNKKAVLEQAIKELGHENASKMAGISYQEMAEIVGKESELGQRLLVLGKVGLTGEMGDLLKQLPRLAELGAGEGEKVLAAAIETYGMVGTLKKVGGWAAIKKSAAMGTAAGKSMEAWRAGLVKELEAFIAKESKDMAEGSAKAVRTGTEAATSDLDVQILGGAAAELQQRAEGWMAGRLDVGVGKAKSLLDAEIFVDPLRSHLIDIMKDVDDATRQLISRRMADKERAMVYGARLAEAGGEGTEAGKKVLAEAELLGITVQKDFQPMSAAAQKRASSMIDGKMGELKAATDAGRKAELAEEIAELQARINASHPDAYVGGGVRIWVSGRDEDVAKIADALGVTVEELKAVSNAQRVTAALTEAKWLEAAVKKLSKPVKPADAEGIGKLAKTVTDVGKHGGRAAQQLQKAGGANAAELAELFGQLKSLKESSADVLAKRIKGGEIDQIRGQIDGLLDNLRTQTKSAVDSIGKDAKTIGVDLGKLAEYQRLVDWQIFYAQLVDAAKGATAGYCELLKDALELKLKVSLPDAPEPNSSRSDGVAVAAPPPG